MIKKKLLVTFVVGLCALTAAHAQDNEFDLGSQRSEIQLVNPVPGNRIDHHGLVINPTPRSLKMMNGETIDVSNGVQLINPVTNKKVKSIDYQPDLNFIPLVKKGLPLRIELVKNTAQFTKDMAGVAATNGAYVLKITKNGINIQAENDLGVFYAIQTLRQMMESSAVEMGKKLPCLEINDAPVFPYRGVVEGFYGTPWSHAVRLSLIDFYGKYKLNTYIRLGYSSG